MDQGQDDLALAFVVALAARNPAVRPQRPGIAAQARDEGDQLPDGSNVKTCGATMRRGGGDKEGREQALQQGEQEQFHRGRSCGVGTSGVLGGVLGLCCGVRDHDVIYNYSIGG